MFEIALCLLFENNRLGSKNFLPTEYTVISSDNSGNFQALVNDQLSRCAMASGTAETHLMNVSVAMSSKGYK